MENQLELTLKKVCNRKPTRVDIKEKGAMENQPELTLKKVCNRKPTRVDIKERVQWKTNQIALLCKTEEHHFFSFQNKNCTWLGSKI